MVSKISFTYLTFWNITIHDSFGYVSQVDHLHGEQTPPISKRRKNNASNIKLSQNTEELIENIAGERLRMIKLKTNCYM